MGKIYENAEKLEKVVKDLVNKILQGDNKKDYLDKKIRVKYQIKDPDFSFYLDPADSGIYSLKDDQAADIFITMEADFMHDFWLKKTKLLKSIKSGEFKVEIAPEIAAAKLIDLLPVLAKGLDIYPEICKKNGIDI